MINLKSIKTQLIIFLVAFAIFLSVRDKYIAFLLNAFIAVISVVGFESFILYLKDKKIALTESSIITGLIIGYVLSNGQPWWLFSLASLFAIGSKHLIRIDNKHLFNPAAFGIFLTIILFGATTQWRGTYIWYILLPLGMYFINKIKRRELLLSYGLTALILFGIQAILQKVPLSNIFGYFNYFFIFVMLIEPRTTPIKPLGKTLFGISAATLIFILTQLGVKFDAELCSLLILNISVPLLNK